MSNSVMYGFMSKSGVPFKTSTFSISIIFLLLLKIFTTEIPIGLCLFGALVAKIPKKLSLKKAFVFKLNPSDLWNAEINII